jgi:hypothetical protein
MKFLPKKYDKKMKNCQTSSYVVAIVCDTNTQNPAWEEVCTVAMAVQNMLLVATAHNIGAYWSSGGVHDNKTANSSSSGSWIVNPASTREFLKLEDGQLCLGWMYVGDYYGDDTSKKWPQSRRKDLQEGRRLIWK